MSFDDLIDLCWLFPRRRRKITFEDLGQLWLERGVCMYQGQVKPWSGKVCTCKGYVFKNYYRGTAYCECGDQRIVHRFKRKPLEE